MARTKIKKIVSIADTSFSHKYDSNYTSSYDGYVITLSDLSTISIGVSNSQDCCESWGNVCSEDEKDFGYYVGAKFLDVAVVTQKLENYEVPDIYEGDIMFVNLNTSKGLIQFAVYNIHNGYYGHTALVKIDDNIIHKEVL